jgi:Uncharacterized alpha/beta hydrolase domain (DUF2235)
MNRQLIICCDGTNNNLTGRRCDTNVAQLCELLAPDSQNQLLYYDPGVGNAGELPEANPWDQVKQQLQRVSSLAYGSGIYENIAEAYRFLMRHWQTGDQIFLYGFSRGAFTARSLGGLITQFGILRPEMEVMVPTLLHIYFLDRQQYQASYDRIKAQITQLFAGEAARQAPVWFVGVWDTVESVGAPLLKRQITATPTIVGKRFHHVRHALALDEFRLSFKPRLYFIQDGFDYAAHLQSIKQEWFSGAHRDVGGSIDNAKSGLPQQALLWMVQESAACGLRLQPSLLDPTTGLPDAALVCALLASRANPPGSLNAPKKVLHSQLYDNALWALAGMAVRPVAYPGHPPNQPGTHAQAPVESPTVSANQLRWPTDTVWRRRRSALALWLAALLAVALWMCIGALLWPPGSLLSPLQTIADVWDINYRFCQWQLAWFIPWQAPTAGLAPFTHPALAVLADFGLLAAYGYLLARASSWAFSAVARLRRVPAAPPGTTPVWLNRLGRAPMLAVLADAAENALTLLLLASAPSAYVPSWEYVPALFMSLAALAKWTGLAGCAILLAWGCTAKLRGRTTP